MTTAPLRVGILGAARVATYAMIAPAKEVEAVVVQAIAARDRARAEAYAKAHGIPSVHGGYDALIERPDIDLIYIATPPFNHAELAIKAMRAGKPVLIEKPIAMNAVEARAIRQTADETGQIAIEAFHWRHHAAVNRALALLPRIGPLRSLEARFDAMINKSDAEFRWNPALGGGALMDLGCYCIHWTRTFSGAEPHVISARMDKEGGVDVATEAHLVCDGVKAVIHTSMRRPRQALLSLQGEYGSLTFENPLAPQLGHRLNLKTDGEEIIESIDAEPTFTAQLRAVLGHLRSGAPFPLPRHDAANNMTVIDAIREASR